MNALAFFEYLGNSSVLVPQKYAVRKSHFTPRCASLRFVARKWKFPCWRGENLPVCEGKTKESVVSEIPHCAGKEGLHSVGLRNSIGQACGRGIP